MKIEYLYLNALYVEQFSQKEKEILEKNINIGGLLLGYVVDCPNCKRESDYYSVEEYDKNKDYE